MGKLYIRSARIENKGYLPEVMITLTDILFVFHLFHFFFLFTPIYRFIAFSLTRPAAWDTIIYGKTTQLHHFGR